MSTTQTKEVDPRNSEDALSNIASSRDNFHGTLNSLSSASAECRIPDMARFGGCQGTRFRVLNRAPSRSKLCGIRKEEPGGHWEI